MRKLKSHQFQVHSPWVSLVTNLYHLVWPIFGGGSITVSQPGLQFDWFVFNSLVSVHTKTYFLVWSNIIVLNQQRSAVGRQVGRLVGTVILPTMVSVLQPQKKVGQPEVKYLKQKRTTHYFRFSLPPATEVVASFSTPVSGKRVSGVSCETFRLEC